jgi:hypothetical protein
LWLYKIKKRPSFSDPATLPSDWDEVKLENEDAINFRLVLGSAYETQEKYS